MKHHAYPFLTALLLTLWIALSGCDSNQFYDPYPQTRILRVDVIPNPVVEGDTVTFICVIADSLDERFEFTWSIMTIPPDTTTKEPIYRWKAQKYPSGIPYVNFRVRADNRSSDSISVAHSFRVYIE
jgi:hypothetical protein